MVGLETGIYYYAIYAMTQNGLSSISNCIRVVVARAPSLARIYPKESTDGIITLNWTDVPAASEFSVYRHNSIITEINSSLTYIGNVSDSEYIDIVEQSGNYYYVVVSHIDGERSPISQCRGVIVDLGKKILKDSGLKIIPADDLADAAKKITDELKQVA